MNRLKFRVWNKEKKTFVTCISDVLRFGCEKVYTIPADSKNYIVQQYSGLNDKNGKEVFEGDIIAILRGEEKIQVMDVSYCEKTHGFVRTDKMGKAVLLTRGDQMANFQIVGNIFENGELIYE